MRKSYDPHSLWILSGATVRIAQRLGLHRDGANHKISPFDAEIRRRTWWQIVFIDGQTSKLAGAGFPIWLAKFDTKIPLNISDGDLFPTMQVPPVEKEGPTEMIFCCLRNETAQALRNGKISKRRMEGERCFVPGAAIMAEKDKAIDEIEARFHQRFLRFCDSSIPLHLLVMITAQSVICTLRIMAHHPRQYSDNGASMSQEEKDLIFTECVKEIEFDSLGHTNKSTQGYLWQIKEHFQLDAFIYLLSELRHRISGELVDRAWRQIELVFKHRPEFTQGTKNGLYFAIGNMALKAWEKREAALDGSQPRPKFVTLLRAERQVSTPPTSQRRVETSGGYQRVPPSEHQNIGIPQNSTYGSITGNVEPSSNWNAQDFDLSMPEVTPVDWEYWQTLMDGDVNGGSDTGSP